MSGLQISHFYKCNVNWQINILCVYSEGAYEKYSLPVQRDMMLKKGYSLQATFDNTVIQLWAELSLRSGEPWIITLAGVSYEREKRSTLPENRSEGTAARQDWEDFEGQNLRRTLLKVS